jgi:putative phage-type endonuclease
MLLSDLPNLTNIIDQIIPENLDEYKFCFNEKEECDIVETLTQLMYDYIDENPTEIAEPDFHDIMISNIKELYSSLVMPQVYVGSNIERENIEEDIDELIEVASVMFYAQIIPPRSYSSTFIRQIPNTEKIALLQKKLDDLSAMPQPTQRSDAWYIFRHNLITASNAYKAFENQNVQNQLIYEKCQPLQIQTDKPTFVNVDTPFHWGQKYEPLSVMYYEKEYNTKVGDFGCIQHRQYSFLGASPDGINNDPSFPNRFGRMLEIKNIVNREIDGIPKKEYWIQMQLQMETCDLDECDFLETRFTEYESYDQFIQDTDKDTDTNKGQSFYFSKNGEWKGIIMYFSTSEGRPIYIYKPLDMNESEFENWSEMQMNKYVSDNGVCWIKNIYWKLEEVSCVLVLRNKKWFADNIAQLEKIWNIIKMERISDEYVKRAPTKRVKKTVENNDNKIENYFSLGPNFKVEKIGGCLIPLIKNNL